MFVLYFTLGMLGFALVTFVIGTCALKRKVERKIDTSRWYHDE